MALVHGFIYFLKCVEAPLRGWKDDGDHLLAITAVSIIIPTETS